MRSFDVKTGRSFSSKFLTAITSATGTFICRLIIRIPWPSANCRLISSYSSWVKPVVSAAPAVMFMSVANVIAPLPLSF